MKREMLLEAWPAATQAYMCLAHVSNLQFPLNEVGVVFESVREPMSKLQACASDRTLHAAQKYMVAVTGALTKLMLLRIAGDGTFEDSKKLMQAWADEIGPLIEPMSNLLFEARAELGLNLDREAFAAGVRAANELGVARLQEVLNLP